MMNAPTKKEAPAAETSIKLDYDASITVPTCNVASYAGLKTEQLAVLTSLISDKTAGFDLELNHNDMFALTSLASELAHLTKELVAAIAYAPDASQKGGA